MQFKIEKQIEIIEICLKCILIRSIEFHFLFLSDDDQDNFRETLSFHTSIPV